MASEHHWQLESLTKTTCPPLQIDVFSPYLGRQYTECETWRSAMIARIEAEHPALVILGVARHYSTDYGFTVYSQSWVSGMAATVRELRNHGIHVLVMGPTPKPPADVPTCLSGHLDDVAACDFAKSSGINAAGMAAERAAVVAAGGDYLDISPWVCTDHICDVVVGNMLAYRDDNHLTTSYTSWLEPALEPVIEAGMHGERVVIS
jgi:hypothetical protein